MTAEPEPHDSSALTALTELYRDRMEAPTPAELDRGLDAIVGRVTAGHRRRNAMVRWSMAAAALGLASIVALALTLAIRDHWSPPEPSLLGYRITGGRALEGGYLRESGSAGVTVQFNEGSQVALTPGTRGRIREVDREGARIAIEHGTASFQITPGAGRRWLVDVGPFLVTVKGTVFTVAWEPLSERFELRLERGRVTVSGPVSAGEITLRAGQRLAVNLAEAETLITEAAGDGTSAKTARAPGPPPSTLPTAGPPAESNKVSSPSPSGSAAAPVVGKVGGGRRWSDELTRGHWDRILADAERIGIETTLGTASSDDLLALADAARYRRRPELARSALLAERRRFPGSPRALDAVYRLGRVEESLESGTAQAIARYDEYLSLAPNGAFAGEALGRKMTLTDKLQGPARARPVAEEYLRRFPHGSYAGSARALIVAQ